MKTDKVFAGSVPALYESHMVPLIFEPYAEDLARRLSGMKSGRVLEIAAGTGVVTRRLAASLPGECAIVATDLNQPMLDQARQKGTAREVEWRQADAMKLPFGDGEFDAVVCQFGVMFFPDKAHAFSEARRVLKTGGQFIFNVWDRIEDNEFAHVILLALAKMFPADPPRFMERTPHGYHDRAAVERDLRSAGFASPRIDTVSARSRAANATIPAVAYCEGTPWRGEIEARGPDRLGEATDLSAKAIAARFGSGPVDGKIQAHVVTVKR